MHAAPSVTYPVGRSVFAALLQAAATFAALAVAALWTVQSGAFGWRQALALAAALACAGFGLAAWLRSPTGRLRWNGDRWSWESPAGVEAGAPGVALDLQSRLLLHWRDEGGRSRWLWLERTSVPADWDALRRAVYSRASAPLQPAGEPPAAEQ